MPSAPRYLVMFESPVHQPKSKHARPANRPKETSSPTPKGPGRPKVPRPEPKNSSRPPKSDARKPEGATRSKCDRGKPADRPIEREELSDGSDEDFFDSASAPSSPPRGSAFSKVTSRNGVQGSPSRPWNDSHFLQPQPLSTRDPRLQKTNRNNVLTRRQPTRNDFASSRRDPHPMYSQPEASMRHPMQSRDASMRQSREPLTGHPSRPCEPTMRPPSQSRDVSVRRNLAEPDASCFRRQPFVELTQRWEDGFLRPPTPPEVLDLVAVEKAKLRDSVNKLIDCPHFTALECVYTLNSIQDTLVAKMEKFCRRREKTESFLRNALSETVQEASRSGRDRVDAWLDGLGPGNQNASRVTLKRQPDQDFLSVSKRRRLDARYGYSRYDIYS